MSDVGLNAELQLDIRAALEQVDALERRLIEATTVTLRADAGEVTTAVDAAIEASDDQVEVTAQAGDVTGAIDTAVDAADDQIEVTGDASQVTGTISSAVDAADDHVEVTGDAGEVTDVIDAAVADADPQVTVEGEASEVTDAVTDAVQAADTSVEINADPGPIREVASSAGLIDSALGAAAAAAAGIDDALAPAEGVARRIADTLGRDLLAPTRAAMPLNIVVVVDSEGIAEAIRGAIESGVSSADTTVIIDTTATDVTSDINAAVDAADSTVEVNADTVRVAGEIGRAVDSADSDVEVNADTKAIGPAVSTAIDRADSSVTVTADTSAVTPAVSRAVDLADTSVDLTADPSGLREARSAAGDLNSALIASSRSGLQLRTILQLGAAGAAVEGLRQMVLAASELEQAIGGTEAIFGPFEGRVSHFAQTAAESAGLTEEAARTLTSQIGGLLQGFQFTQQEAADLSITLAQLGADLAATFGGTTQEAVEALGAAIRGETDPIERFGISLNATQADLRAVELGLAASTSEVSANARAQGVLSLIMERSAQAQGQFGREVDTTAGQLERAKAEAGNAAAEIGATLQPAINDLIATVRGQGIPAVRDLALELGPALGDALLALAPAFGTTTELLLAAAPAIRVVADVLQAIPDPVIQAIAVFALLRSATGGLGSSLSAVGQRIIELILPTGTVASAFNQAGQSTASFSSGLRAISAGALAGNIALAGLTTMMIGIVGAQQRAREAAAELEAQQESLEGALAGTGDQAGDLTDAFEVFVERGLRIGAENFGNFEASARDLNEWLSDLGVTTEDLAEAAVEGEHGMNQLAARLEATGDATSNDIGILRQMVRQVNEAARATVEAGTATEEWSQRQADAAIAANENADGTTNWAGALQQLQRETAVAAEYQTALAEAAGGVDAEGQSHQITALGLTLEALQLRAGSVEEKFISFALAAEQAGLSGAQLDAVAAELGVDAEALSGAIEGVAGPILNLAEAAAGTLPSIQELAGDFEEFSVTGFRDELRLAYQSIVDFQENLQVIAGTGNERLAAIAAELGPQYAQVIAEAVREGNTDVLAEMDLLLEGLEQEGVDLNNLITGEIGPQLVEGTGQVGQQMTDAFGANWNPENEVPPTIASVEQELANAAPRVESSAGRAGEAGTRGLRGALEPASEVARNSFERAELAIAARAASMESAGRTAGNRGTSGLRSGTSGMPGVARRSMEDAVAAAGEGGAGAYTTGHGVGSDIGQGLADGVVSRIGAAVGSVISMVASMAAAGRRAAQTGSPSRLFRDEIGIPIGQGIAVGIDESAELATAAVRRLVEDAANVATAQFAAAEITAPVVQVAPEVALAASSVATAAAASSGPPPVIVRGDLIVQVPPGTPITQQGAREFAQAFRTSIATSDARVAARLIG
ncbi:MAG TPA: hypothetical protein VIL36_06820 [Acidimicrobiales bacterium]